MTLDIKGIPANYVVAGEGEPVLILPGWGATSAVYNMISKLLSEKYKVYSLDLPGFGITPEPKEPMTVDDYTDFVTEFIEKAGLDNLTLIGHSFGGRIILKLCSRENKFNISKLVLIDAAGIKHELSPEAKARQDKFKKMKKFYSKKLVSTLCPNALEKLQNKYGSADYAAASPVMKQCLVKAVNEDLTDIIPCIKCETNLIWGISDTATPVADAEKIHSIVKNSTLDIIENAGHFPFIDNPFDFMKALRKAFNMN